MPPQAPPAASDAPVPPAPKVPNRPATEAPAHFQLFGIPVRVGVGFWLLTFLLGQGRDLKSGVIYGVIVFVSILLHELGHALVARRFGASPAITLHAFGGLTSYRARMSRWESGLVSAAGPAAGMVFGLAVYWGLRVVHAHGGLSDSTPGAELVMQIVADIVWVNVGWGLFNLIPVMPFDGGHILAVVLGPRRMLATSIISATAGIAFVVYAFVKWRSPWALLIVGSGAVNSIVMARRLLIESADRRSGLEARLAKAKETLDQGDPAAARVLAENVIAEARSPATRVAAWQLIAWSHVATGDGMRARQALSEIGPLGVVDPYLAAVVEDAAGEHARALALLEAARRQGMRSRESTKLFIDLEAREGNLAAALTLAAEDLELLGADDTRSVLGAGIEGGAYREAAALARKLFDKFGDPRDAVTEARALSLLEPAPTPKGAT